MCRWLAYVGSPVLSYDALYTPAHSLVGQSLHSRLGAELLASVCQSLAGRTLWSTTRLHQCWPLVLASALAADTLRTSSLTLLRRAHDAHHDRLHTSGNGDDSRSSEARPSSDATLI